MPTTTVSTADLHATLARLRLARTVGDELEAACAERRLNWLLEQLPTTTRSPQ